MCPISFFENKRCIDVACGDRFTVVIAEVFPDKKNTLNLDFLNRSGPIDIEAGIKNKLMRENQIKDGIKSVRKPLCGGDNISI